MEKYFYKYVGLNYLNSLMIRMLLISITCCLQILNVQAQKYFITVDSLDRYGLVDTNNKILLDSRFSKIDDKRSYLLVTGYNRMMGVYNKKLKEILPIEYKKIKANCNSIFPGWIAAKKGEYFVYYDSTGNTVLSDNYKDAFPFRADTALVLIQDSDKIFSALINRSGDIIRIADSKDKEIFRMGCGVSGGQRAIEGLKKKGKYYGIFYNDEWLIEPKYDLIKGTIDYFYLVRRNNFFGVLNNEGKLVLPVIYKKIKTCHYNGYK
ncbi:WG repeat-containing protein [Fulvivirgaceae bacterium BMA12]|uniref:WG repeat-containing protein n=1 Tax=Agaribacillus aureus TaxID=3051825 RepID=A0ABT8LES5_9BACT|nr:WG repeat-containing protein [Fulvivirgaceae bacterium BMA12]